MSSTVIVGSMRQARFLSIAAALLALTALPACGDDEDATTAAGQPTVGETATAATSTDAAGIKRYCDLQYELDQAVDEVFRKLGENATGQDAQAALREFVAANDDKIAELEQAAPPEIKDDVALLAADARASGGVGEAPSADLAEVQAAERRVEEFEGEAGCVD